MLGALLPWTVFLATKRLPFLPDLLHLSFGSPAPKHLFDSNSNNTLELYVASKD